MLLERPEEAGQDLPSFPMPIVVLVWWIPLFPQTDRHASLGCCAGFTQAAALALVDHFFILHDEREVEKLTGRVGEGQTVERTSLSTRVNCLT